MYARPPNFVIAPVVAETPSPFVVPNIASPSIVIEPVVAIDSGESEVDNLRMPFQPVGPESAMIEGNTIWPTAQPLLPVIYLPPSPPSPITEPPVIPFPTKIPPVASSGTTENANIESAVPEENAAQSLVFTPLYHGSIRLRKMTLTPIFQLVTKLSVFCGKTNW